ncbi:MAG: sensor histidine kinase [Gemmatimonadaceae bacterium]|nr:sensor histidine kinase [Gemmatimonadaceae bacterium]
MIAQAAAFTQAAALAQAPIAEQPVSELATAALQATITAGLALVCLWVWRRTREPHFAWWAVAFGIYDLRIGAISAFLATGNRAWLFWHQVVTGWTALALFWAAMVFAHRPQWRRWYWALLAFPLVWSDIAVNRLENFALAAAPAVIFISATTLWTGVVLLRHRKPATRTASTILGWTFLAWGVHHLDYPILRAQGAWLPWGYYLDIFFVLGVGAGILLLVNADLASRLQARTAELERLSRLMVRQHEDERHRLSIALHDETAQVFAAVKMQLGVVREQVNPAAAAVLDRAITLFDDGIQGVRRVTRDLRPALLDDLGLLPALRSLVGEFVEQQRLRVTFDAPQDLPVMPSDAEVAVYRAVQEALTNVSRHASGAAARVRVAADANALRVEVSDDGPGLAAPDTLARADAEGHLGITGMRERIGALGGDLRVESTPGRGLRLSITIPVAEDRAM